MNDKVLMALIIAAVVLLVLYMFRRQLKHFLFKAGKDGIEAQLDTHDPTGSGGTPSMQIGEASGVNIEDNSQLGQGNVVDVGRGQANVKRNKLWGKRNKIIVRADKSNKG